MGLYVRISHCILNWEQREAVTLLLLFGFLHHKSDFALKIYWEMKAEATLEMCCPVRSHWLYGVVEKLNVASVIL